MLQWNLTTLFSDVSIKSIDLQFIHDNASNILASTNVEYLTSAELRGSLFQTDHEEGLISSVFTNFFVDHTEPLAALEDFQSRGDWCLGELLDGHEYLLVIPVLSVSSPVISSRVEDLEEKFFL